MKDKVCLHELKADTFVGTYDWEQQKRQQVVLDITLTYDCHAAAQADDLTQALDYEQLASRIVSFLKAGRFRLLERLAEQIAELILKEFPVEAVNLQVSKPCAVEQAQAVSIHISRP